VLQKRLMSWNELPTTCEFAPPAWRYTPDAEAATVVPLSLELPKP
jgi:hypothetical protein